ncbi:UNC-like C-terminal-domain-containing protein [Rhizophagus diaphanus]|nr:UNC-like C-terminal-domain-containing protein [Rhizophagus diaphanus] [Rhizophagus sp. MUCL 43196]
MLYTYSQDKLNKADFALSSGGAKIIVPLTSPTYEQWPTPWLKLAIAKLTGSGITRGKPPITALQPETHVGQCWPFAGQQGQLAVLLSRRIYVTAITYDHVSKTVAMGTTSAPKEFEVWAFIDDDNDSNEKTDQKMEQKSDENIDYVTSTLKNIPSNQPGSNILDSSSSSSSSSSSTIIMKVNSNWDNPSYTCLYRFRVHGKRADANQNFSTG